MTPERRKWIVLALAAVGAAVATGLRHPYVGKLSPETELQGLKMEAYRKGFDLGRRLGGEFTGLPPELAAEAKRLKLIYVEDSERGEASRREFARGYEDGSRLRGAANSPEMSAILERARARK